MKLAFEVPNQSCRTLCLLTFLKFYGPVGGDSFHQTLTEAKESLIQRRVQPKDLVPILRDLNTSIAKTRSKIVVLQEAEAVGYSERDSIPIIPSREALILVHNSLCVSTTMLSRVAMSLDSELNLANIDESFNLLWPPSNKWHLLESDVQTTLGIIADVGLVWMRNDDTLAVLNANEPEPGHHKWLARKLGAETMHLEEELWSLSVSFYALLKRHEAYETRNYSCHSNIFLGNDKCLPTAVLAWNEVTEKEDLKCKVDGLRNIHNDIQALRVLQEKVAEEVKNSGEGLDRIELSTQRSRDYTTQVKGQLARTARVSALRWTWEGGAVGAVVGAIAGLVLGPPGALMGGAAGGAMGSAAGKALQRRRDTQMKQLEGATGYSSENRLDESEEGTRIQSFQKSQPPSEVTHFDRSDRSRRLLPGTSGSPISNIIPRFHD